MKRIFAMILALCLALSLCACGGQNEDTTPATTDAPDTTAAPTESEGSEEAQVPDGMTLYTVKVVDEGGNPIAAAMVQMCQGESCLPGATGEDGVATFTVPEAEYKVSFLALPAGFEYTTEETEFYFDGTATDMTITLKAVA